VAHGSSPARPVCCCRIGKPLVGISPIYPQTSRLPDRAPGTLPIPQVLLVDHALRPGSFDQRTSPDLKHGPSPTPAYPSHFMFFWRWTLDSYNRKASGCLLLEIAKGVGDMTARLSAYAPLYTNDPQHGQRVRRVTPLPKPCGASWPSSNRSHMSFRRALHNCTHTSRSTTCHPVSRYDACCSELALNYSHNDVVRETL
jgi:hypothetical protein